MASILDFFSGSASPEQRASLAGLAAMFNGALGDGSRPANLGAALSAGALGAQQGRQQHVDREQAQAQLRQLAAMRDLQMRSAESELQAQERAQGEQAAIQQAAQSAVGADGQFDQDAFLRNIRSVNALKAMDFERSMAKAGPKFDTKPQTAIGDDGKPFQYLVAENGEIRRLDGVLPRDEVKWLNLDNRMVAASPYAAAGTSLNVGVSPSAQLSANVAMRGQNMTDARAREANQQGKIPPGYRWTAAGKLEAIPGGPADQRASKEGVQRVQDARDVLTILDEAEPLLSKSTSSYLGAGADQVLRAVGQSTAGGEAAAQLKVLQGQLVAKMPKMSGPQSDKDVQLYREMAGQIGDPTLPETTRRAAAQTIRKLNQKYLQDSGAAPAGAPAAGGVKFLGFEN